MKQIYANNCTEYTKLYKCERTGEQSGGKIAL